MHQVLEIDPENTPARLQLLSFAIREQNMDEVIKLCAPALEYTPDVLEFYYYMGLAYHQKEKQTRHWMVLKRVKVNQVTDKSNRISFLISMPLWGIFII